MTIVLERRLWRRKCGGRRGGQEEEEEGEGKGREGEREGEGLKAAGIDLMFVFDDNAEGDAGFRVGVKVCALKMWG